MTRRTIPILTCVLALLFGSAACDPPAGDRPQLTLYSGRAEALVGPLLERFTEVSGIAVRVSYEKTPALATRILAEGAETPADVFLAQDSGYLTALAGRDLLAPLPDSLLRQVDARFRDAGGRWIGTSGRARVLVYNPDAVPPAELPGSLRELADSRWRGRIGWAPGNASFQAHVSALRHAWGEQETREWLAAVRNNAPVAYPKNSPQVEAVASGEIDIGWVNHYYLHKLRSQVGGRAANFSFPSAGDAGNVLMTSGAAVLAASERAATALRLLEFLVSEEAQRYFAQETYEYPTRPGVATHPDVPPIESLQLAEVDPSHLTDLEPTLALLRGLDLQ